MTTTLSFKSIVDVPTWRPESPQFIVQASGSAFAYDMTNDFRRNPIAYFFRSAAQLDSFNPVTGEWMALISPAMSGSYGVGDAMVFHPSQGPRGTIAAGATVTSVVLSTVLPAAVAPNQLANRGDGVGHRIRIIGLASGKTEERTIVGNTSGTTPTITVDVAFSFTPATSDLYEIRSGRIFIASTGGFAAGSGLFKYYDIATNSMSGNLVTTSGPATTGLFNQGMFAMSENYVSNDRVAGSGFVNGGATTDTGGLTFNCVQATATSGTTITGSAMPASLIANEYTNFQVRIVEDTVAPTAAGQRRRIASHTSGATGVFTVAAWGVTPSTSAKFVIEFDDDKLLFRTNGALFLYNYNITANTWDSTTWAVPVASGAGSIGGMSFGITRDPTGNARQSMIYFFRGITSTTLDVFDIANGSTGTWSNATAYANASQTIAAGTSCAVDPFTLGGRYMHINASGSQRMLRFDMRNRTMEPGTYMRFPQGAAQEGNRMFVAPLIDGATKLSFLYQLTNAQVNMLSVAVPF